MSHRRLKRLADGIGDDRSCTHPESTAGACMNVCVCVCVCLCVCVRVRVLVRVRSRARVRVCASLYPSLNESHVRSYIIVYHVASHRTNRISCCVTQNKQHTNPFSSIVHILRGMTGCRRFESQVDALSKHIQSADLPEKERQREGRREVEQL